MNISSKFPVIKHLIIWHLRLFTGLPVSSDFQKFYSKAQLKSNVENTTHFIDHVNKEDMKNCSFLQSF